MPSLLYKIAEVKWAERQSPEAIQALQNKRLRRLLVHAWKHSAFYRRHWSEHGVAERDLEHIPLSNIPPVDKPLLMEHFDEVVCMPEIRRSDIEQFIEDPATYGKKFRGTYQVIHTSGTSGKPGIFIYGERDWNIVRALAIARVSKNPINPFHRTRLAFVGAVGGHYAGVSLAAEAPRALFDLRLFSIDAPMQKIVAELNEFQPSRMSGYTSGTLMLAEEQMKGGLHIAPERIMCSADALLPLARKRIEEAFHTSPFNVYSSSESLAMGAECEQHRGIHLFADWHVFELVEKNGTEVAPGQSGTLSLTNLYNYTFPFIRYNMSDRLRLAVDTCSCASPLPRAAEFEGRELDLFYFNDGHSTTALHPSPFGELFAHGLNLYQVVQTSERSLLLLIVAEGNSSLVAEELRVQAREIVHRANLDFVSIETKIVAGIPNDPKTRKFKVFVPLPRD